jgi:hypothetical protein
MTPENFRRAQLGLSVHGPFSRNRRRPLSHHAAAFLASGLLLFLLLFLTALFS